MRILKKVDALRVSPVYRDIYSQRDDDPCGIQVTDELYHRVIAEETGYYGLEAAAALEQVYSSRWAAESDPELKKFLSGLVHVKFDRARPCPVVRGGVVPGGITVHRVGKSGIRKTTLHELVGRERTVLFAGSWT